MPRIRVDSITIQPTYATLNGAIVAASGVPTQPFNIPVSKDEVYDKVYEPGNEYDLGVTPIVPASQPFGNPDTEASQQPAPLNTAPPAGSSRA
jgi:hypothetical protein